MSPFKFFSVFFFIIGLLLAGCSKDQSPVSPADQTAMEKEILTDFTLTHYPIGLTGEGSIKLVGNNWILKDVGVTELLISGDPLAGGVMTHYLSATMDAVTGEGPIHGRFTIVPDANTNGGTWEGTYTGYRSKMPGSDTLFVLPLKLVGHGINGTLEGMQMQSNTIITAWGTPPVGWYGSGEGFYKSHD